MKNILIVDDNELQRCALQVLLHGNGYQVIVAAEGAEALVAARLAPPDLIVTDILMPVMDGYTLCREWKKDERLKAIPLVFYTGTYTDNGDREFALGLGAERFIVKPEEPQALLHTIREVLQPVQRPAAARCQPTTDTPVPAPPEVLPLEETVFLQQYNATLIRRLETKTQELERTNRELAQDIVRRKHAESELRVLSAALTSAANAIVITDRDGNLVWANPAFTKMTGYTVVEAAGKNPRDLVKSGKQERAVYQTLWNTILTGGVWQGQLVNRRKDGSFYPEEQTITPVLEASGEITHFIAIKQDLTERKKHEEALRQNSVELRVRNETLTRFNDAAVGRELRMIELKREVNELCAKLGEPPRFGVAKPETAPTASKEGAACASGAR